MFVHTFLLRSMIKSLVLIHRRHTWLAFSEANYIAENIYGRGDKTLYFEAYHDTLKLSEILASANWWIKTTGMRIL
jgi:hypothetical protein